MTSADDLAAWGIRQVSSPIDRRKLRAPDSRCHTVQFDRPLTDGDYRTLAEWLAEYPRITLRAWGWIPDLEFLRFFPRLRRFSADTFYDSIESFYGLRHLDPDLRMLGLGATTKKVSLKPLARFTGLRALFLEGHTKDIDVLAGLNSLVSLTLRSITLPDLALLLPLTRLRALDLKLGGTRDLSLLPRIGRLEYLELVMVRGLDDLSPVSEVTTLRYLFLQALRRVEALPDFSRLTDLETAVLETMKGLTDLAPLLSAPGLRQLALTDMGHFQPEKVAVLAAHPRLEVLSAGLGSDRKNRAVKALVPLPSEGKWTRPAWLDGND